MFPPPPIESVHGVSICLLSSVAPVGRGVVVEERGVRDLEAEDAERGAAQRQPLQVPDHAVEHRDVGITATHAGFVAMTFWVRVGNALVSTQGSRRGRHDQFPSGTSLRALLQIDFHSDTPSQSFEYFAAAFLAATTCLALDTEFRFTSVFGRPTVLTNVWMGA
ncbi:hypothetical protein C8Q80DRAFT_1272029 [Daedaleopsis nitida]|nr:hypothetical protein C8Q80DRAFT_1272029 [Daedaleopsis nitida]